MANTSHFTICITDTVLGQAVANNVVSLLALRDVVVLAIYIYLSCSHIKLTLSITSTLCSED